MECPSDANTRITLSVSEGTISAGPRLIRRELGRKTAPCRGFHERATWCQGLFTDLSSKGRHRPTGGATQHSPSLIPFLRKVFACPRRLALLPFALFIGAVCPGASWSPSSQNGRCHLRTELSRPRFRKRSFRRDLEVTRTRRLATKPNYIVLSCLLRRSRRLAVAQRLVHFPTHP